MLEFTVIDAVTGLRAAIQNKSGLMDNVLNWANKYAKGKEGVYFYGPVQLAAWPDEVRIYWNSIQYVEITRVNLHLVCDLTGDARRALFETITAWLELAEAKPEKMLLRSQETGVLLVEAIDRVRAEAKTYMQKDLCKVFCAILDSMKETRVQ